MKRILVGALLAAALGLAAAHELQGDTSTSGSPMGAGEPEPEDEGDSAPFTIVVEHADGWRCGGSLVSLRTALTSARCARGRGGRPPRELWALAPDPPAAPAARRVVRIALAASAEPGRDADLAVLELESPFGGEARARPILMATRADECAPRDACHAVRALGRAPRLRIVDAALASGEACAIRAPGWAGARDAALCLVGPVLCASEWGAGVVCGGKLCGVVSRSVAGPEAGDAGDASCGDTHVAQSVARWRRFLHCAHTLRACGRGGECAQLCSERQLFNSQTRDEAEGGEEEPPPQGGALRPSEPAPPARDTALTLRTVGPHRTLRYSASTVAAASESGRSSGGSEGPTRSTPAQSAESAQSERSPRPAHEFEPNRPDFKGEPARTSRVYLKAGEYGDNAAEYGAGGEEGGAGAAASGPPVVVPMGGGSPPPPAAEAELAARRPPGGAASRARSRAALPPRASPLLAIAELILNIL